MVVAFICMLALAALDAGLGNWWFAGLELAAGALAVWIAGRAGRV